MPPAEAVASADGGERFGGRGASGQGETRGPRQAQAPPGGHAQAASGEAASGEAASGEAASGEAAFGEAAFGEGPGTPARGPWRILILEDEPADAELEQRLLIRAGLDFTAVVADTRESFVRELAAFGPELILADFALPGFSGESALRIAQRQCPGVPFIFLSGVIGDEAAVELIKQGATDYVLKDQPARLASVVRRALAEAERRLRLARLEAHLQRAQRMEGIGRLAAGVAHEFNNQVGAMLGYAALIQDEAVSRARQGADGEAWDGIRRDAEQIACVGERVVRLVRQLLAAGGQQTVRADRIDLNQVVGGIDELLRSTVGAGVGLQLSLAPRLWPVAADPGQVEQVLLHLTMNARDAMPHGGSFRIETRNVTIGSDGAPRDVVLSPGAYVCLTARDSGHGMRPEVLEHAFEPFFTTKPFVEAGGLGLASVYGIVTQAGGTVGITSAPGAGTTVTVWLPAVAGGPGTAAAAPAEVPGGPPDRAPAPG